MKKSNTQDEDRSRAKAAIKEQPGDSHAVAEKALQANYELLDRIFSTTHFCLVNLDRDLNFVRVNRAYADAGGHPPEFFIGKNHFDLYPNQENQAIFREVVASGQPFTIYAKPFEYPGRPELGVSYWDWTLHPLKDGQGQVEGLLFALLDVTRQVRAMQELERKTALAQLLEALAHAVNEAATPEDAMNRCLSRLCVFGQWRLGRVTTSLPRSGGYAVPADSVWQGADLGPYESFIRASQDIDAFGETGQFTKLLLRDNKAVWLADLEQAQGFVRCAAARADGLRCAFAFPVLLQGLPVAFLEFFGDSVRPVDPVLIAAAEAIGAQIAHLIERSRAAQRQAQLAVIVENSNDAIFSYGLDGKLLTWNAAAQRLFGYAAEEVSGQGFLILVPAEERAAAASRVAQVMSGIEVPSYEGVRLGKGGRRIDIAGSMSPIRDLRGNVSGISLIFRDISELKQKEEELRDAYWRQRQLSQRLRSVEEAERRAIARELHDRIGQDLSTVGLLLASLGARLPTASRDAVEKPLSDIQGLLKSMSANVRDVMAELRPPALDDYGLLPALRQLATEFSLRTGIAVDLDGVELLPRLSSVVETTMFRISQEALSNVAKHARANHVAINLHADADLVVLEIADDGSGFDVGRTLPAQRHWGLGTMRERAEEAGIAFMLESTPGAGTRVVLEVKRVVA